MIPLKLTVKNFMCYRDNVPTLGLEGVHVACLCGDNGHGKTALLDAITWALWGEARARTQDELIHQGQQDMAVELEFTARGQRYRVSRSHSRPVRSRQGATLLELQVASDNGFRPVTGNSIAETEAGIRQILHMDYDTFVSTAFLLQGRADMFTTSTPSKRKERLAEVLDLSSYQALEERARGRSRAIEGELRIVIGTIQSLRQQIGERPKYEEQLASAEAELARVGPATDAHRVTVDELSGAVDALRRRQHELDELAGRLDRDKGDLSRMETQLGNHKARVSVYEDAVGREPEIQTRFAHLARSRSELERLNQGLSRKSKLDMDRAQLEKEVAVQGERLREKWPVCGVR